MTIKDDTIKILPDRKLMPTVGGGHEVPWHDTESTCFPNYEYPSDFRKSGNIPAATKIENTYAYQDYAEATADILDPGERLMTREEFILEGFGWYLALEDEKKSSTVAGGVSITLCESY